MDRVEVGYVARAHGVRGELRVHTHDPASTTLLAVERVWIGGAEHRVLGARATQGAILLRADRVPDRTAAEKLKGASVEVARADVALEEGEVLVGDLVGCAVFDPAGAPLGVIAEVLFGPQDLLVIRDGERERLLPLVPEFLVSVDAAARRVVVAPPEDLPVEKVRP